MERERALSSIAPALKADCFAHATALRESTIEGRSYKHWKKATRWMDVRTYLLTGIWQIMATLINDSIDKTRDELRPSVQGGLIRFW